MHIVKNTPTIINTKKLTLTNTSPATNRCADWLPVGLGLKNGYVTRLRVFLNKVNNHLFTFF